MILCLLLFFIPFLGAQDIASLVTLGLNPELAMKLGISTSSFTATGTTSSNATRLAGASVILVTPNANNATARLVNVPTAKQICVINVHALNTLVLYPNTNDRFGTLPQNDSIPVPPNNGYCFIRIGATYYPTARTLMNFDYSVNITITNFGEEAGDLTQLNATARNIRFINSNTGLVFDNASGFIRTIQDLSFQTGTTTRFILRQTGDLEFTATSGNLVANRNNFTISNLANNLNINATQNVNFLTNSITRWSVTSTGDLANDSTSGGNLIFNRSGTGVAGTSDMRISVPASNTLYFRVGNNDVAWVNDSNVTLNRALRFAFSGVHILQDSFTINVPTGDYVLQIGGTERLRVSGTTITTNLPIQTTNIQSTSALTLTSTTANPISLRTNNTERFVVDASGNFVQNATSGNNIVINRSNTGLVYSGSSGALRIGTTNSGTSIQFAINNTPFIELTPSGVLQVVAGSGGQIVATQGSGTFENVTWTGTSPQTIGTVAAQPIRLITNNTTRWRITSTGVLENDSTGGSGIVFNSSNASINASSAPLVLSSSASNPEVTLRIGGSDRVRVLSDLIETFRPLAFLRSNVIGQAQGAILGTQRINNYPFPTSANTTTSTPSSFNQIHVAHLTNNTACSGLNSLQSSFDRATTGYLTVNNGSSVGSQTYVTINATPIPSLASLYSNRVIEFKFCYKNTPSTNNHYVALVIGNLASSVIFGIENYQLSQARYTNLPGMYVLCFSDGMSETYRCADVTLSLGNNQAVEFIYVRNVYFSSGTQGFYCYSWNTCS